MAARAGKQALFQYKGVPVLRFRDFTVNINGEPIDVTSLSTGTVQWREFIAGLSGADFTANGFWDMDGSTAQKDLQTNLLTPATGTVRLEADKVTGGAYSFDTVLTNQTITAAVDAETGVSFSGVANGAVTYSTTT